MKPPLWGNNGRLVSMSYQTFFWHGQCETIPVVLVFMTIALLALCVAAACRSCSTAPYGCQEEGVFRYLREEECPRQKSMTRLHLEDVISQ